MLSATIFDQMTLNPHSSIIKEPTREFGHGHSGTAARVEHLCAFGQSLHEVPK